MKKFILAGILCLPLLLSSCAVSQSATSNNNLQQTEVVLAKKNFKIIGTTRGESAQNYWLFFGGLSKKSLSQSAMSDMYDNANLTGSQAIINVSVAYKQKFMLIHGQAKAIATGTIIEFTE